MAKVHPKIEDATTIIRSGKEGNPRHRLLIITPTLGTVRMEWAMARYGQATPCNWSASSASLGIGACVPMHFLVADAQNLGCEDCLTKGFNWCFPGQTLIETANGAKPIRDIAVGEMVKSHTGAFRSVTKTMSRQVKQGDPLIWLRTRNGVIKCTPEHPFFVLRNEEKTFIQAKDLTNTDELLYPCGGPIYDSVLLDIFYNSNGSGYNNNVGSKRDSQHIGELRIDRDMARFLGLFLAEGHCNKDGIAMTFNNGEADYISFVKRIYKERFGRDTTICRSWSTQVRLSIGNLAKRFKEWFGEKAPIKRVPVFVFDWNILNKLSFLKGYFDGDGSYKENFCSFSSANKELINDIIRLGNSCGLSFSTIYSYDQKAVKGYEPKFGAQIHLCNINTQSLAKLNDLLDARHVDDYLCIPVLAIENHKVSASLIDSKVYNLEVEEDNSYIANGASVHNCLLWEDDVVAPYDAMLQLNKYIVSEEIPVVSGLYFTKGNFSEPIIYRGKGNGPFLDFKIGDRVWADGVPTGFLLIHSKVIKLMWDESESYKTLGGRTSKKVFETPAEIYYDPKTQSYSSGMGTSDLWWCNRVIKENVLTRAGWPKIGQKKYPFLCDTKIFCDHIDLSTGRRYPPK